jgi:ribose 1,5-bisphosphate isomerase
MSIIEVAKRIKNLEIQGATSVALAGVKAIHTATMKSKAKNKHEFFSELHHVKNILFKARPTEPMLRNYINLIIHGVEKSCVEDVEDLKKTTAEFCTQVIKEKKNNRKLIAEIGSKIIANRSRILTHCHSSAVIDIFKMAKADGKRFEIFCTETRPLFQGRITARNLLRIGIKTTMIIDSAVGFFIKDIDSVIVGADAVTRSGDVINKIGTATIAKLARDNNVPFYVATESLKFDPEAVHGEDVEIEERDESEIWKRKPTRLSIRNPAFDITKASMIRGIITEFGIISPSKFSKIVIKNHPEIFI